MKGLTEWFEERRKRRRKMRALLEMVKVFDDSIVIRCRAIHLNAPSVIMPNKVCVFGKIDCLNLFASSIEAGEIKGETISAEPGR